MLKHVDSETCFGNCGGGHPQPPLFFEDRNFIDYQEWPACNAGFSRWLLNIALENGLFLIGTSSINGSFSIAMWNNQRVVLVSPIPRCFASENRRKKDWFWGLPFFYWCEISCREVVYHCNFRSIFIHHHVLYPPVNCNPNLPNQNRMLGSIYHFQTHPKKGFPSKGYPKWMVYKGTSY